MREVNVQHTEFAELSAEVLAQGGFLHFRAHGFSMFPFIRDGDILMVQPVETATLNVGDVLFYRTDWGWLVAHRVVDRYMQDDQVLLKMRGDGDSGPAEQIRAEQVLGRVAKVQRGEKVFHMGRGTQWLAALVWPRVAFWGLRLIRLVKIVRQVIDRFLKFVVKAWGYSS